MIKIGYLFVIKEEYIKSLHRPFNTRLKTVKWVCDFTREYQGQQFRIDFFIYVIKLLHKVYKEKDSIYGLPQKDTINTLFKFLNEEENYYEKLLEFTVDKKNITPLDKQMYSNLKAVSYYTNLAKNLGFLNLNDLTAEGKELISLFNSKKNLVSLTNKEQDIFIQQLLKCDFVPFIFTIFYTYFEEKYPLKNSEKEVFDEKFLKELDIYLGKRDFKLKRASWRNYIIVRQTWIKDLELIQSNNVIKSKLKKTISSNIKQKKEYDIIQVKMLEFEKIFFKKLEKFRKFKQDLYSSYVTIKKNNIFENIGYINLYDIKKEMNISTKDLEVFLEMLHDEKINRTKVFFNNIIAAIDNRKRFVIKKTQILNIKIIGKLV